MSVLRRLYNVAYGKVRVWQSGETVPEVDLGLPRTEPPRPRVEPEPEPASEPETEPAPAPAPRERRL
jgi:hypothetical protein